MQKYVNIQNNLNSCWTISKIFQEWVYLWIELSDRQPFADIQRM